MKSVYEMAYIQILPAIRKEIANRLRAYGMKETEIAKRLNITQAAVSKYLKEKQEVNEKLAEKLREHKAAIEEYVEGLLGNKSPALCALCQKIGGFSCQLSKAQA